ncbi:MAG: hypothetical protein ACREIA_04715 [Opitutaceae bacterium]
MNNLRLARPLSIEVETLPEVLELLGWTPADAKTPGAYPKVRRQGTGSSGQRRESGPADS